METCDLDFQKNKPDLPGEERHCTWGPCAFGWAFVLINPQALGKCWGWLTLSSIWAPCRELGPDSLGGVMKFGWVFQRPQSTWYQRPSGVSQRRIKERRRRIKKWITPQKVKLMNCRLSFTLNFIFNQYSSLSVSYCNITSRAYMDWVA